VRVDDGFPYFENHWAAFNLVLLSVTLGER
jgi:hypothetical protein